MLYFEGALRIFWIARSAACSDAKHGLGVSQCYALRLSTAREKALSKSIS